jgi:hypothetical protein
VRAQRIAHGIGAGLIAGLAGTAAMTASAALDARLLRRHVPSPAPAVAKSALGIEQFATGRDEARFDDLAHWGAGAGWGVLHGLLRSVGLGPRLATGAHYAAVAGGALVVLPAHDIVPPVFLRTRADAALEAFHQLVYAGATGLVFELLARED